MGGEGTSRYYKEADFYTIIDCWLYSFTELVDQKSFTVVVNQIKFLFSFLSSIGIYVIMTVKINGNGVAVGVVISSK